MWRVMKKRAAAILSKTLHDNRHIIHVGYHCEICCVGWAKWLLAFKPSERRYSFIVVMRTAPLSTVISPTVHGLPRGSPRLPGL